MADWNAIENAVMAWVIGQSGLAAGKHLWAHSNASRPDGTFITAQIGDVTSITAQDELLFLTNLTRPAGQEIEQRSQGMREFGVTLQCFAPPASGPAVPRGSAGPRAILSKLQTALALPSVVTAFDAVGIAAYDLGAIRFVPEIERAAFEGRAVLEVRFYMTESASEYAGYIDTVEATDLLGPPSGTSGMDI